MTHNYILPAMTHLRYFIPIIAKANNKKIKSRVFIGRCNKYCCPHRYKEELIKISKKYNFDLLDINEINNFPATTFVIEGDGLKYVNYNEKIYSITYMTDFSLSFKKYIDKVSHVIFPNKYFANYYNVNHEKNLYFGSPKYSFQYDSKEKINQKYKIKSNNKKNALIIFPRLRDVNKIDMKSLYQNIQDLGYNLIVKSRGKDPIPKNLQGDHHFLDLSWYPHTTLELLKISDVAINFSSTVIKECIMLNVPVINFHIKPFVKPLEFLYNFDYCRQLKSNYNKNDLINSLKYFSNNNLEKEFKKCRNLYLFEKEKVVDDIINHTLQ